MTRLIHALLLAGVVSAASANDFVPFAIPGTPLPPPLAYRADRITTASPRVVAKQGHFLRNGERIKFLGVNTTFGGNLPSPVEAARVAKRLAASGINSVRIHHLDTSNYPAGIWRKSDGAEIEPEALRLLDNFIHELANNGIYTNLNLHVGRKHSKYLGLPDPGTDYDKIVDLYMPQLVDAQKGYAAALLDRVNPARGVRYADDPAIAMVEITNEDSFFMWDADEKLRALPVPYSTELQAQFNGWLRKKYGDDRALRAAWGAEAQPLGANALRNADLKLDPGNSSDWILEQHSPARARLEPAEMQGVACAAVRPDESDGVAWHLQLKQPRLAVKLGKYYTIAFRAAAEATRTVVVSVQQDHAPWENAGLSQSVQITPDWTTHTLGFSSLVTDSNVRLSFQAGADQAAVYVARAEFRTGGQQGLGNGESMAEDSVAVFAPAEVTRRARDRDCFFAETEKRFHDGMRAYIRSLGCKALVTGTIVFGPLGLYAQSDMDFVDGHAYWQHPHFPGRPWDMGNWTVEQKAMVDSPAGATLPRLACARLAGKPFTVTEYNHPAPNDYQAECVPMLASYAAVQDWDGIWLFDYGNRNSEPDSKAFRGFFDIAGNPSKWGFVRGAAAIFRDGAISAASQPPIIIPLGSDRDSIAGLHRHFGASIYNVARGMHSVEWQQIMNAPAFSVFGKASPGIRPATGRIDWAVSGAGGAFRARDSRSQALSCVARAADMEEWSEGAIISQAPEFIAFTIAPLDSAANQLIVTACGRCENTGMQFSQDRRTVARQFGGEPVRIEAVSGRLRLPQGEWKCEALSPRGTPTATLQPVKTTDGAYVELSPRYTTMWYLLTRADRPE